jgi:hypothetical protein
MCNARVLILPAKTGFVVLENRKAMEALTMG